MTAVEARSGGPESEGQSAADLDRTLVRGLAWTGAVKWFSQVLSWVSTIVVARLLSPDDYGIVAMAGVFVGLIGLFNEFGLGAAVVALRQLSPAQISSMHSLASLLGIAGFAVTCAVAYPAGRFYASSDVPLVIAVMGVGFAFIAMRSVPSALLERGLQFKLLALLEGAQAIVTSLVTLGLAYFGAGYWALVWGGVAGHLLVTTVVLISHPVRYARPSFASLEEALRFSSHVLVGRISWYVAANSDVFVAGRVLGQSVVGAYSFSTTLANLPLDRITALLSRVMPAFYSSVQSDRSVLRRYLLLLNEGLAFLTFPIGIGVALVAPSFVPLVLGEQWLGVVLPLQVLASWAVLRSIFGLVTPVLFVTGGSRVSMWSGVGCMIFFPIAFWIGSRWGAVGIALALVVVQPIFWIAPYHHIFRALDLSPRELLATLRPAALCTAAMALAVLAVRPWIAVDASHAIRFACEVAVGASVYAGVLLAFHRARLLRFLGVVRGQQPTAA